MTTKWKYWLFDVVLGIILSNGAALIEQNIGKPIRQPYPLWNSEKYRPYQYGRPPYPGYYTFGGPGMMGYYPQPMMWMPNPMSRAKYSYPGSFVMNNQRPYLDDVYEDFPRPLGGRIAPFPVGRIPMAKRRRQVGKSSKKPKGKSRRKNRQRGKSKKKHRAKGGRRRSRKKYRD